MSRRIIMAWILTLTACAGALAPSMSRAQASAAEARRWLGEYRRDLGAARQLLEQRASLPGCVWAPYAEESVRTLTARWQRIMPAAGLDPQCLVALSPLGRELVGAGGSGARIERSAVTIGNVTLPRLGALLEAWRRAEPCWRIAAIEIVPEPGDRKPAAPAPGGPEGDGGGPEGAGGAGAGGERPLRVVLTIESIVLAISPSGRAQAGGPR
jgi:hypothetical protein